MEKFKEKIAWKTSLIVSIFIGLLVCVFGVFYSYKLINWANAFDSEQIKQDLNRLVIAFESEEKRLLSSTIDYAAWDDTLRFMTERDQSYLERNYVPEMFSNNNFSQVLLLKSSGEIIFFRGYDPASGKEMSIAPDFLSWTKQAGLIERFSNYEGGSGFLIIGNKLFLLGVAPVTNSRREMETADGLLIVIRMLSQADFRQISGFPRAEFSFLDNFSEEPASLAGGIQIKTSKQLIEATRIFPDIDKKRGLEFRLKGERKIFSESANVLTYLWLILIVVGVLNSGAIIFSLQRILLSRISALRKGAFAIAQTEDYSLRVEAKGQDEIAVLGGCLNFLLEKVEKSSRQLQESETNYRLLFAGSVDAILVVGRGGDNDGIILNANSAAARLHKYEEGELIGLPVFQLYPPGYYETAKERIGALKLGETWQYKVDHVKKGGKTFPVEVAVGIVPYGGQECVLAINRDLSLEEQVEAGRRQITSLESVKIIAGGVAHDFNNVLAIILGHISLVEEDNLMPKSRQRLGIVIEAIERARKLTYQLLALSKGGSIFEKKDISLRECLEKTIEFCVGQHSAVETVCRIDDLWPVKIDSAQCGQVLQNLLINALQAMGDRGRLEISARNEIIKGQRRVLVIISDNGKGIEPENLARIFEPGFTTKGVSGSGLGLPVCQAIISNHQGTIDVQSAPGKGTTFLINLPVTEENPAAKKEIGIKENSRKLNVLLMDDDQLIKELFSEMLKKLGHNVISCSDGDIALSLVRREEKLDLAILDLTIVGGMGGCETARRIKSINPEIRIIAASGYSQEEIRDKALFRYFLAKPCTFEALKKAIDEAMA